jgi:methylated-DNA-protein-cysteine methyltransferase-like protein
LNQYLSGLLILLEFLTREWVGDYLIEYVIKKMKISKTSSASQEMAEMILAVVSQIPYAKVATYGQIARLAGLPKHARLVGRVLSHLNTDTEIPWYRVINAQAKISLKQLDEHGQNIHQQKLMQEGIILKGDRVDLKCYQWDGLVEI